MGKAIAFHGHACPGLAIGVRAATEAIKRLNSLVKMKKWFVLQKMMHACGRNPSNFKLYRR